MSSKNLKESMDMVLKLIQKSGKKGMETRCLWMEIFGKERPKNITPAKVNDSLEWLLDNGLIIEPINGTYKINPDASIIQKKNKQEGK